MPQSIMWRPVTRTNLFWENVIYSLILPFGVVHDLHVICLIFSCLTWWQDLCSHQLSIYFFHHKSNSQVYWPNAKCISFESWVNVSFTTKWHLYFLHENLFSKWLNIGFKNIFWKQLHSCSFSVEPDCQWSKKKSHLLMASISVLITRS
jgi:hypothetical protein